MLISGISACVTALVVSTGWALRKTWRRILPWYWALAALVMSLVGVYLGIPTGTIGLLCLVVVAVAAGWPARSRPVRIYRATIATILGLCATLTVASGQIGDHPTMTVFVPCLLATVLGWPWWHHLRSMGIASMTIVEDESLTALWSELWRTEVVEPGTVSCTSLTHANRPRDGVIEATIRLRRGAKLAQVMKSGPDIEIAFYLNHGAVGWRKTGKTAILNLVIVEKSYILDGYPWAGSSYDNGTCQIAMFTDGTPGEWTFYRPGFGTLNGLIVGSSGAGKTRALGVLIANLLSAGWDVAIGDCQNGQSLPAWRNAVGEYHQGPDTVKRLVRRLFAEVMERSDMLSKLGIDTFDDTDPRIKELGLKKLAALIDECQLILIQKDRAFMIMVEAIVALCRKTGVSIIFSTQLPQMKSLGGSMALRDALVAGNAFIMRLSNRGSGATVLPDDFVGDPFAIPQTIDKKITAGMGYLRTAPQQGMLCRVPLMDETSVASQFDAKPIVWNVDQHEDNEPAKPTQASTGGSSVERLREGFGLNTTKPSATTEPVSAKSWILSCLTAAPTSAQSLLNRTDCPANQAQIYAVLGQLVEAGAIRKPAERGGQYTII